MSMITKTLIFTAALLVATTALFTFQSCNRGEKSKEVVGMKP